MNPAALWWRRRLRPEAMIDRAYRGLRPDFVPPAMPANAPSLSILMPVRDPEPRFLRAAIASALRDAPPVTELCIADDGSVDRGVIAILADVASDPRVRLTRLAESAGIAAATNAALAMATGEFIVFLDHDDVLAPYALARVATELAEWPAEMLFSDEDRLVEDERTSPYFKPGWNPDLMQSQNLVCHLAAMRRDTVLALGGLREGFEGAQDYDLALRVAARPGARIRHVPAVLYHWRATPGAMSATRAEACQAAAQRAIADSLRGGETVRPHPDLPQWHLVTRALPTPPPTVSIIGPGPGDPTYPACDIANDPAQARGDVLLFLSNNLAPAPPGWLATLVAEAIRPEIGAVGARLDGPDGAVLHAGYVLDETRIGHSPAPGSDPDDPGYRGHFILPRTVSAVSIDCLAVRRDRYLASGGLDPAMGPYAAIDLCLKLAALGGRTLWTPTARLRYRSRPVDAHDPAAASRMRAKWGEALAADPFHNPNLALTRGRLRRAEALPLHSAGASRPRPA